MASANDPSQNQNETSGQQAARAQTQSGGNGGTSGGQQVESRERSQQAQRSGSQGRALGASRGRRDLSTSTGNPFEMMWQLSREMDRMMSSVFGIGTPFGSRGRSPFQQGRDDNWSAPSLWSPRIDVEQREDSIMVWADLPGVRKDDIQIEVSDEGLTLSGERREEREAGSEEEGYRRTERSYGSFYRTIPLPQKVNTDQLKARMRDGVLQITIPLDESARPRRIPIEE